MRRLPEMIEHVRIKMGLDGSLLERYLCCAFGFLVNNSRRKIYMSAASSMSWQRNGLWKGRCQIGRLSA